MTKKLAGKIAVITGGTEGIGLATAKLFVKEGAYVFITGRRQKELEEAVKSIGSNVFGVQGDVAKLADLDRLYETVAKVKGRIDIVFANAGVAEFVPFGAVTEGHDERWEAALARAKARHSELNVREFGRNMLRMLATRSQGGRYLDRLVVKGSGTTRFIRVADIDWIEGPLVCVNLLIGGKELLYRSALNELGGHLDPLRFIRVHRSSIVNIDKCR